MINPDVSCKNETQNNESRKTKKPSTTKQMLTVEDKINVNLIMKITTEKKTTLPTLRNQN